MKSDNTLEIVLVNANKTVPCSDMQKVPESFKDMNTSFLNINDVRQVMSSGCEEMTSNAFIVKEEMNLEQLRDVKPDNLNETVLVNVNETVPCPKLEKSVNEMGTPFVFVGVKKEIPDDYENEASCGILGTQNSSQENYTIHDTEYKGVDECLEGTSPMVLRNICNIEVKMEHEQDSEIEFDLQTSDVLSMTTDTNCTFDCKSEEEGCDVHHSSEEFIKGMDCLDHPILRMKQERENPDKQIAVNRKNSGFTRKMDTLNFEEEKDLNETRDEAVTLTKDCGTEFNPENNSKTRNNTSKGNILSRNLKAFTCDICQKSFLHNHSLKAHLLTHTGERPYTCDICEKSFTYKCVLKSHLQKHTNVKPYSCDICKKSFLSKNQLKNHSVTHSDEKPFSCDICHRSFSRRRTLNEHLATHSSEKPYKCDICQKSFSQKNNIRIHMHSHSNERPYKCDICHKSFRRSGDLRKHETTHSTEKPYSCNFCSACFSLQPLLKKHVKIHTQPKPVCDICEKSFTEKSLKQHMLIHTGEKTFTCDICHETFRYRNVLNSHMQSHTK